VYSALQILNDAPFQLAETLYYKHALVFLSRVPGIAGDAFLTKFAEGLSPLRLLPSMMNYERMRTERARLKNARGQFSGGTEECKSPLEVHVGMAGSSDGIELKLDSDLSSAQSFVDDSSVIVKYLEGVIKQGCKSSALYIYVISLYVKLDDEEPLLAFLSTHVPTSSAVTEARKRAVLSGDFVEVENQSTPLDMSYALRAVLETGRHFRSAVKLYMGFGMRQQAVELALKVDPALARELAQDSVEIDERKRLWLMIAKNAASDGSIRGRDVVSRVVAVLRDCGPEVLSIEDVLPFL
jgi:vacuolar protein sorting-associated protein 18